MDELDIATDRAELEREYLLLAVRRRQSRSLLPLGECYHCGEEVERPRLFCGADCAEQFEARRR